jgi:hypothetical protein
LLDAQQDALTHNKVNYFNLPNPYIRSMTLAFTHPLTEMSTRRSFWGTALPACKANNFTAICEPIV